LSEAKEPFFLFLFLYSLFRTGSGFFITEPGSTSSLEPPSYPSLELEVTITGEKAKKQPRNTRNTRKSKKVEAVEEVEGGKEVF